MRSSKTTVDRQGRDLSKLLDIVPCAATLGTGATSVPVSALNIGTPRSLAAQAIASSSHPDIIEIRAATRGRAAVGPRAPGMCWNYSDPARMQGFSDDCP